MKYFLVFKFPNVVLTCVEHEESTPVNIWLTKVERNCMYKPGWLTQSTDPEVIKLFPCSTQQRTKFILLVNVKMPTIVGILTFISMINTTPEILHLSASKFSFYEQLEFRAQLS